MIRTSRNHRQPSSQPARPIAEAEPDRARYMDFLLQKWKQACSCHLNVPPSRKRPASVAHDRHGRKDRPGDRGTARGATPVAKLAPMPSFEAKLQAQHEPSAHRTDVPRGYKCNTHQDSGRNPLARRETLRRMRGTPIQQCTERPWPALEHSFRIRQIARIRGRLRPDTPNESMPQTRRGSIPDDYTAANTSLRRSRIAQTQTHREKRKK